MSRNDKQISFVKYSGSLTPIKEDTLDKLVELCS